MKTRDCCYFLAMTLCFIRSFAYLFSPIHSYNHYSTFPRQYIETGTFLYISFSDGNFMSSNSSSPRLIIGTPAIAGVPADNPLGIIQVPTTHIQRSTRSNAQ